MIGPFRITVPFSAGHDSPTTFLSEVQTFSYNFAQNSLDTAVCSTQLSSKQYSTRIARTFDSSARAWRIECRALYEVTKPVHALREKVRKNLKHTLLLRREENTI